MSKNNKTSSEKSDNNKIQKDLENALETLNRFKISSDLNRKLHLCNQQNEKMLYTLIELKDGFEKIALSLDEVQPEAHSFAVYIHHYLNLEKQLDMVLSSLGFKALSDLNKTFDEFKHEVVGTIVDKTRKSGTIVKIQQQGYMRDGQIVRPAKVIVVKN